MAPLWPGPGAQPCGEGNAAVMKPIRAATGAVISGPNYRVGGGKLHLETRTGTLDISLPPNGPPQIVESPRAR